MCEMDGSGSGRNGSEWNVSGSSQNGWEWCYGSDRNGSFFRSPVYDSGMIPVHDGMVLVRSFGVLEKRLRMY